MKVLLIGLGSIATKYIKALREIDHTVEIIALRFTGSNLFDESVNLYVVAYMMLIPMFLGYLLFGYALKTISASTATTLTLFEPLVAALFAVLLVGEQLAPIGWVGMVLIFVCLAVLSKTDRPK